MLRRTVPLLVLLLSLACQAIAAEPVATHVLHISVDGLAPRYLQAMIDQGRAPTFKRLQNEGAWTHNARTDFDYTITLPNHTSMITSRGVMDKPAVPAALAGHSWVINGTPGDKTLHGERHAYVKSTFDVAHDNGLHTGLFPTKSKFVVYDQSYDARNGAPDEIGQDNGRDKIDVYFKTGDSAAMVARLIEEMKSDPFHYVFVHFHDTDSAGHAKTWGSDPYNDAIAAVDAHLGKLLALIDGDERLHGTTAIILSADHGGTGLDHGINRNPLNYTIPFYVWGPSVAVGKDLYELNRDTRQDPNSGRPDYTDGGLPPVRNGDGGNLAMHLLGLGAMPGSTINASQNLKVH